MDLQNHLLISVCLAPSGTASGLACGAGVQACPGQAASPSDSLSVPSQPQPHYFCAALCGDRPSSLADSPTAALLGPLPGMLASLLGLTQRHAAACAHALALE